LKTQSKEYYFQIAEDSYKLKIEIFSDQTMHFCINQINKIQTYYYEKEFTYEKIIKTLKLLREFYKDIEKIFKFYDTAITKKKVLLQEDKEKRKMILNMSREIDFDTIQCDIELEEKKMRNEEMTRIIIEELNKLKNKQINNQEDNQEKKYEKNDDRIMKLEEKINKIEKERNIEREELKQIKIMWQNGKDELKNEIKNLKEELKQIKIMNQKENNELKNEIKILKEEIKRMNLIIEDNNKYIEYLKKEQNKIKLQFKEDPCNLKYLENITNNNSCGGLLYNFTVYNGLKDNIEYIVYNNKNNYNIEIMRINDKTLINSLKGHNNITTVIRYFLKDNKEDYILSCDFDKLVIVWDIQNNYNKKYNIKTEYFGNIYDALLLFNIFNNNYILISSGNNNEFSKLYEFKNNTPFIRNIYGTNENFTYFVIPWLYKNKYYTIECCDYIISINNLLDDECYANLTMEHEGYHYSGYIYNDNYLCVSDDNNNSIRIWNLVNKVIYKEIKYDGKYGREIIPWNNKYAILGCFGGIVIVNIEEGKMVTKIKLDNTRVRGVKKMKINKLGECLIISDNNSSLKLYKI